MHGLIRFVSERRYLLASSVLVALMAIQTANEQWSNDFWEHSAVVRELKTHPLDPRHPLLAIDAPHPYFSPYLLGVAGLARLLDMRPIPALQMAGLLNLLLFLVGFRLLVRRLVRSRHAPFYGLIFAVVLWGPSAWRWSGFINLNSLGFGLPFPSMFALAVSLLSLAALSIFLENPRPSLLIGLAIGAALVLLAHPITAVVGGIFAGAIVITDFKTRAWRRYLAVVGAGAAGAGLAFVWPYFSLLDLISEPSILAAQNVDSRALYEQVLQRTFPALVALPLLLGRLRSDRRDPLVIAFAAGALAYLWGFLSGNFVYGRMLVIPMLVLHIALGRFFAQPVARTAYAGISVLLAVGLVGATAALVRMVPYPLLPQTLRGDPRLARISGTYGFLEGCTRQYDVVLTDLGLNSLVVPTFGGKIVATTGPRAFVPDWRIRAADVRAFFGSSTIDERRAILLKHRVSYVLLNRSQLDRVGAGLDGEAARSDGLVLVSTEGEVCTAGTT